jgi:hypothetical protein
MGGSRSSYIAQAHQGLTLTEAIVLARASIIQGPTFTKAAEAAADVQAALTVATTATDEVETALADYQIFMTFSAYQSMFTNCDHIIHATATATATTTTIVSSTTSVAPEVLHTVESVWARLPDGVVEKVMEQLCWARVASAAFRSVCKGWQEAHDQLASGLSLVPRCNAEGIADDTIPPQVGARLLAKFEGVTKLCVRGVALGSLVALRPLTDFKMLNLSYTAPG